MSALCVVSPIATSLLTLAHPLPPAASEQQHTAPDQRTMLSAACPGSSSLSRPQLARSAAHNLQAIRLTPLQAPARHGSSSISHQQQQHHHLRPVSQQQQQLSQFSSSRSSSHVARMWPFDQAWGTQIDGQSLASQLFAMSLFPYLAFLFYLHRSGKTPRLTLIGFYFLLAFVGATIPAGIYAKSHYGTSLANVDWLHGSAESLLTVTNLLVVLGLRQGIKEAEAKNAAAAAAAAGDAAGSNGNGVPAAAAEADGSKVAAQRDSRRSSSS